MTGAALEIAGVRVDLRLSDPGASLPRRLAAFSGHGGGAARWTLTVRGALDEQLDGELPPARHVVEAEGRWRVPGAEARGWIDPASSAGEASGGGVLDTLLRAVVAETALERGGLLVHAAALAVDGRAHLCPARSGSGKSTLASRAGHPLCDELSIVLPAANGWLAHATPWWRSAGGAAPLAAVYELAWDGEGVTPAAASPLRHLLANLALLRDTPALRAQALAAAAAVARTVPLARLAFRPGSDVDALLRAGPG